MTLTAQNGQFGDFKDGNERPPGRPITCMIKTGKCCCGFK